MSANGQVLQVINNKYPFGASPSSQQARVEETQTFSSMESLMEKRSEMLRKQEMLSSPSLIRLLGVRTEGQSLVYEWEHVPHSIGSYVRLRFGAENAEIREMASKLLLKKVTYELTVLMSYLAKMRIETELSPLTLGVTSSEKLKLYLNPRSKMGIRSELFLISHYGQAKEKVLRQLQAELQLIRNDPTHPNFKATRPYFENKLQEGSLAQSLISTSPRRQASSRPKMPEGEIPFKRKMSIGNFDFGHKQDRSGFERGLQTPQSPKPHKYSCQFHPSDIPLSASSSSHSDIFSGFDQSEEAVLGHSKSIRIELEQMQDLSGKRKRKDSYKVKITTYREYEVGDTGLFKGKPGDNEEDIFQYFAKQARREETDECQSPKMDERHSPRGETKREEAKEGLNTTAPSSPPMSPLLSPTSKSKNLEERLRQARERSERVLTKMKFFKK